MRETWTWAGGVQDKSFTASRPLDSAACGSRTRTQPGTCATLQGSSRQCRPWPCLAASVLWQRAKRGQVHVRAAKGKDVDADLEPAGPRGQPQAGSAHAQTRGGRSKREEAPVGAPRNRRSRRPLHHELLRPRCAGCAAHPAPLPAGLCGEALVEWVVGGAQAVLAIGAVERRVVTRLDAADAQAGRRGLHRRLQHPAKQRRRPRAWQASLLPPGPACDCSPPALQLLECAHGNVPAAHRNPPNSRPAWKSRSLPPMWFITRNAAWRAGPMALSTCSSAVQRSSHEHTACYRLRGELGGPRMLAGCSPAARASAQMAGPARPTWPARL